MKDIKGYEGLYAITSCGKVWSYRRQKFLTPIKIANGYYQVSLCVNGKKKNYLIHRLVGEAYLPNPNNLPEINHIDRIPSHNFLRNLEWCDRKYNVQYSKGKKVRCVETGNIYNSIREAGEEIGIHYTGIKDTINGRQKTAGGYHWEVVEEAAM